MEKLKYAETVIAEAHKRTMAGTLKWRVDSTFIKATVIDKIGVMISFSNVEPDSARWEYVNIDSPVGAGWTMVGNPVEPKSKYLDQLPHAANEQIDQIFARVLLDPRRQAFEAAMKKLSE